MSLLSLQSAAILCRVDARGFQITAPVLIAHGARDPCPAVLGSTPIRGPNHKDQPQSLGFGWHPVSMMSGVQSPTKLDPKSALDPKSLQSPASLDRGHFELQ